MGVQGCRALPDLLANRAILALPQILELPEQQVQLVHLPPSQGPPARRVQLVHLPPSQGPQARRVPMGQIPLLLDPPDMRVQPGSRRLGRRASRASRVSRAPRVQILQSQDLQVRRGPQEHQGNPAKQVSQVPRGSLEIQAQPDLPLRSRDPPERQEQGVPIQP